MLDKVVLQHANVIGNVRSDVAYSFIEVAKFFVFIAALIEKCIVVVTVINVLTLPNIQFFLRH